MKRYIVLESADKSEFELEVNAVCLEGMGKVVASNVYVIEQMPVYYALIEKSDDDVEKEVLNVTEASNYKETRPEAPGTLN